MLDRLHVGHVNRAGEVHAVASGKGLNVGLALHLLEADSKSLAVVGSPDGDLIKRQFREQSVDVHWIESAANTRVCTTILDR